MITDWIDLELSHEESGNPSDRKYWIGERPGNGKKWGYTTSGTVLNSKNMMQLAFDLYQIYVIQWNEIESNLKRPLSDHKYELYSAKVIDDFNRFILYHHNNNHDHWILEIWFYKKINRYKAGLSCCLKPLDTVDDIRNLILHWSDGGYVNFKNWCKKSLDIKSA